MRKNRSQAHKDRKNTSCSIRMHQNLPFLMKKRQKKALFLGKSYFFGVRHAVKAPSSQPWGAGCKKAGGGDTQITQTQCAATVCTQMCHFSSEIGQLH